MRIGGSVHLDLGIHGGIIDLGIDGCIHFGIQSSIRRDGSIQGSVIENRAVRGGIVPGDDILVGLAISCLMGVPGPVGQGGVLVVRLGHGIESAATAENQAEEREGGKNEQW